MWQAAAAQAASQLAGGVAQGMGGPNLSGGTVTPTLDGSGWTVSTGGSRATGSTRSDAPLGTLMGSMGTEGLMWVGAALLLVLALRKARK